MKNKTHDGLDPPFVGLARFIALVASFRIPDSQNRLSELKYLVFVEFDPAKLPHRLCPPILFENTPISFL